MTSSTKPNLPLQSDTPSEAPLASSGNQATSALKPPTLKPLTLGQKVADKMATKIGSWGFLIGQTTFLIGWVSLNLIPGAPKWDAPPFILLNLFFSFASAYTAPVVLMSQNRQSEEDRENANQNYQVTLQAAQRLELLHQKLDTEYSQKLDTLTTLIRQQQAANAVTVNNPTKDIKVIFVPIDGANVDGIDGIHVDTPRKVLSATKRLQTQPQTTGFVQLQSDCFNPGKINFNPSTINFDTPPVLASAKRS